MGFFTKVGFETMPLVQVNQSFHRLFKADRDEEAAGDGAEVNPEVFTGVDRFVRWVDFHQSLVVGVEDRVVEPSVE